MELPSDYAERVYAGVLGKVIGVYLGRPFEGWTYERIQRELGDIETYVHERLGVPLVVTDDDITGTFTFLRALEDHGTGRNLTAREVGETWLNYLVPERTVLWWGGLGNSTEHTAYLRLKNGIAAPESGSMARNGKVVAEQIGAQIFIDGWAMVAPGDPDLAVRLATEAARVSHDGEAVFGAQVLAAMESMAFVERCVDTLLDEALRYVPADSVIATMIRDLRTWHAEDSDWRRSRALLAARYGYDTYGGNCHMVPNHGLIVLALLHGESDFAKSLQIVNTSGWDTDCNSGNLGCLLGIKEGLVGIDAGLERGIDWRGPVADRVYLPTADGGRAVSDCAHEALQVINLGRSLRGEEPLRPKGGAPFHFAFPGSVQGFQVIEGQAELSNVDSGGGARALRIETNGPARVETPVFTPSKEIARWCEKGPYPLLASPRVFPGQTLEATVRRLPDEQGDPLRVALCASFYGEDDEPSTLQGSIVELCPGQESADLSLEIPDLPGPVFAVGVHVPGKTRAFALDALGWRGAPRYSVEQPKHRGTMWRRAWVNGVDALARGSEAFRLVQNEGTGLLLQGTRDWRDISMTAELTPHLVERAGVAVRAQGMTRYYALLLAPGKAQLVRRIHSEAVLEELPFDWQLGETYVLTLRAKGPHLVGAIDGTPVFEATDSALGGGAMALVVEGGRLGVDRVQVAPA